MLLPQCNKILEAGEVFLTALFVRGRCYSQQAHEVGFSLANELRESLLACTMVFGVV